MSGCAVEFYVIGGNLSDQHVLIYIRGAIKKFLADPSSVHNIIKIVFASYSSPLELHLTTSELWFGQEQEGILPELLSSSFIM